MRSHVLVIGAGGFIGRALCQALNLQGTRVKAVSRGGHIPSLPGIEQITNDCSSPSELAASLGDVDAVVYLAACSTPGSSAGKPSAEISENLAPLMATLEALQSHPSIPLIYFSSAGAIYDEQAAVASCESDLPRPRSYHGAAKVAAEQFIGAWARQFGGGATIIRPSNVYGPGQAEKAGFGIVPTALGCIRRDEALTVWGDGSAVRDYLYIDDLVDLTLAALKQASASEVRILNAASRECVSLNELLSLAELASGQALRRNYVPGRAVDASRVSISADCARQTLGWQPAVPLAEGLKRTWLWLNTTAL
ncbi:NAD-dependent epimerase/dehydratase family protein [Haliea salexigens]|uniref:NAD-dependent epimerase/dehydratase family protein n=1 Tax=Haliea salexigens TaxID=287487 RepID=UPI000482C747|nr:NAD-dependent epimerase/dehydratase family protein [Haliea salexigens]